MKITVTFWKKNSLNWHNMPLAAAHQAVVGLATPATVANPSRPKGLDIDLLGYRNATPSPFPTPRCHILYIPHPPHLTHPPPPPPHHHTLLRSPIPLPLHSRSMSSSASFSVPFLLPHLEAEERDSLCLCCSGGFDDLQKKPRLLRCGHSICSNCVTAAKSAGLQELKCNVCDLVTNLEGKLNFNRALLDALQKGTNV